MNPKNLALAITIAVSSFAAGALLMRGAQIDTGFLAWLGYSVVGVAVAMLTVNWWRSRNRNNSG